MDLVHPEGREALDCNLMGSCPFLKNLHNPFGKNCLSLELFITCFEIFITCFEISDQVSYAVQEFILKNDTLKKARAV